LHRYLKFKYGEGANGRLSEGLMMAAYAREAEDIQARKLDISVY